MQVTASEGFFNSWLNAKEAHRPQGSLQADIFLEQQSSSEGMANLNYKTQSICLLFSGAIIADGPQGHMDIF